MARKMVTARALQMRTATAYAITGLPQAVARKMVTARALQMRTATAYAITKPQQAAAVDAVTAMAGTDVIDNIKTFRWDCFHAERRRGNQSDPAVFGHRKTNLPGSFENSTDTEDVFQDVF